MQNNPLVQIAVAGISAYVLKLWLDDFKAARRGQPNKGALPGAFPTTVRMSAIAAIGGLVIVVAETWGEVKLGLSGEQSQMTVLFAAYTLLAAFVEEIIFRGYIVVEGRGVAMKWAAAIGASVAFAALHPFLWDYKDSHVVWQFGTKGYFSTAAVFVASLWFYFVRLSRLNTTGSLIPCFAAHFAKNAGVIAIKAGQGFLVGLY
jgi:uncharacterized protein